MEKLFHVKPHLCCAHHQGKEKHKLSLHQSHYNPTHTFNPQYEPWRYLRKRTPHVLMLVTICQKRKPKYTTELSCEALRKEYVK